MGRELILSCVISRINLFLVDYSGTDRLLKRIWAFASLLLGQGGSSSVSVQQWRIHWIRTSWIRLPAYIRPIKTI